MNHETFLNTIHRYINPIHELIKQLGDDLKTAHQRMDRLENKLDSMLKERGEL